MNQWALFPLGKTHDAQLKEYIKESATRSKLRFGAGYLAGDLGFGILVFFPFAEIVDALLLFHLDRKVQWNVQRLLFAIFHQYLEVPDKAILRSGLHTILFGSRLRPAPDERRSVCHPL